MRTILAITGLLFLAPAAQADYMLKLTDGTAVVWDSYYVKGTRYCTRKAIGEVCWAKADVRSIKKVPAGTEATEYGLSEAAVDSEVEERKKANSEVLTKTVEEMEQKKKERDAEIDRQIKQRNEDIQLYGEREVLKKERKNSSDR